VSGSQARNKGRETGNLSKAEEIKNEFFKESDVGTMARLPPGIRLHLSL
jgi:hypothetical protein